MLPAAPLTAGTGEFHWPADVTEPRGGWPMSPSRVLPYNVTLTALSQGVGHMCPPHAPKLGYVLVLLGSSMTQTPRTSACSWGLSVSIASTRPVRSPSPCARGPHMGCPARQLSHRPGHEQRRTRDESRGVSRGSLLPVPASPPPALSSQRATRCQGADRGTSLRERSLASCGLSHSHGSWNTPAGHSLGHTQSAEPGL